MELKNPNVSDKKELSDRQLLLSGFVEKAARCFTEQQVKNLRVKFAEGDQTKCGVCGVSFWGAGVGMVLPSQRHHCYCCGKVRKEKKEESRFCLEKQKRISFVVVDKNFFVFSQALCNACTVTVQMENGHAVDGLYRKDFVWTGKFCIDHDLITGQTKPIASDHPAAAAAPSSILPSGPLEWIGFIIKVGQVVVSVFPVVSSLGTAYRVLPWTYRVFRLFV
jgi:hypothetical protein